jgi:ABC-type Fe3+ transport system permease subunit
MYLSRYFRIILLVIIFLPIISGTINVFMNVNINMFDYFLEESFTSLFLNSVVLTSITTLLSVCIGIIFTLIYIYLTPYKKMQFFYLIQLFIIFSISSIIYLNLFQIYFSFNALTVSIQSIIINGLSLSALSGLLFIFSLLLLDLHNIRYSKLFANNIYLFQYIIKPKFMLVLVINTLVIFAISFNMFEVPSILGYRTYSEDFLVQISLVSDLKDVYLPVLPYYFISILFTIIIMIYIKKYKIIFYQTTIFEFDIEQNKMGVIGFVFLFFFVGIILGLLLKNLDYSQLEGFYEDNIETILLSILISFFVACITLFTSIYIYRCIQDEPSRFIKNSFVFCIFLVFFLPSTSIALEILVLKQLVPNINLDYVLYIWSQCLNLLPIGVLIVYIIYMRNVRDEALTLYNMPKKYKLFYIHIPRYIQRWVIALMILMVFSLNELAINILLIPIGLEVLIIKIYNLLHYGDYNTITFLALNQIIVVTLLILVSLLFIRKKVYNK